MPGLGLEKGTSSYDVMAAWLCFHLITVGTCQSIMTGSLQLVGFFCLLTLLADEGLTRCLVFFSGRVGRGLVLVLGPLDL